MASARYLIVLMSLLLATETRAQSFVMEFKILPPGHETQLPGTPPTRVRYYLFKEYLQLAQFDAELTKLRLDAADLTAKAEWLKKELAAKDDIIKTLEDDKRILTTRSLRLDGNWKKCEDDLVKCSSPCIWPYIVGAVGAVIGLVGVGVWVGGR